MKIQQNTAVALLALAFLTIGSGCSVSPGYSSVLTDEGMDELCFVDAPPGEGEVVVGEVVTNNGDKAVTITEVTLRDAEDILIGDASIIPMKPGPGTSLGVSSTLTKDPEIRALLDQAVPAAGYVIAPGELINVLIEVSIPDDVRQGTALGIDVRYEQWPAIDVTDTRIKMTMTKDSCF